MQSANFYGRGGKKKEKNEISRSLPSILLQILRKDFIEFVYNKHIDKYQCQLKKESQQLTQKMW